MNSFNDRGRHISASAHPGIAPNAAARADQPHPAAENKPVPRPETRPSANPAATFVVIWQFEVAEQNVAAFETAYGPNGSWAQLFRSSPDYRGTELLRDAYVPFTYLTVDRWAGEDAFRAFRRDHDAEYEKLDRACDALTSRETRIGAYTV